MLTIKKFGKDRMLINTSKWDDVNKQNAHTHIPDSLYHHPNKVALRIRYNIRNKRLPRRSKFVTKYVGNQNFERYIESHIRVCKHKKYINKLVNYLKVNRNKGPSYKNVQKGGRR